MSKRYCGPCDEWVTQKACPQCGADTDKAEPEPPTPRLTACPDCGGFWTFDFIAKRVYCKTCDGKTVTT